MKKSTEDFKALFPDTAEGYAQMTDGFYYVAYSKNYVYHFKEHINDFKRMFQVPEDGLIKYEENSPDADELVNLTVEYLIPQLALKETNVYHGKVIRLEDAKKIVTLNRDVDLPNLPETIIPYKKARDLILRDPDHICVIDCPCRSTKENGCYPRDVCMIVGEPFVSFVMDHNNDNPRRITQDEALAILKAEDERGHVHTAYFKDAMGDRFYCICNCCKCCCTAMNAHFMSIPMMAPSGYQSVRNDKCTACGTCHTFCQFGALSFRDGKTVLNPIKCMGCGICESKCRNGAISLEQKFKKCKPLDIDVLLGK